MKMLFYSFFIALGCLIVPTGFAQAADQSLQPIIDKADSGDVIHLRNKVYKGPVSITKPVTIVGKAHTIIASDDPKKAVVAIKTDGVELRTLQIDQRNGASRKPAVSVSGKNQRFLHLSIKTSNVGINMNTVKHSVIQSVTIRGYSGKGSAGHRSSDNMSGMDMKGMDMDSGGKSRSQADGLVVSNSSDNVIKKMLITHVSDGIYIENSDRNIFTHNIIKEARYGFHLMFSDHLLLKNNQSADNLVGAMVMETKNTQIENNTFADNEKNVHAYGLLLFETSHSSIAHNTFLRNRVGLEIERAHDNAITDNLIGTNFIGIQFSSSKNNLATNNTFTGNVNDAQAAASRANQLSKNYWDNAWKLDLNKTRFSQIVYRIDPFFLSLTKDVPEYQLFFQSPGMNLLQKMLKSADDKTLADKKPLMSAPLKQEENNRGISAAVLWAVSLLMIMVSTVFIIGGKRA